MKMAAMVKGIATAMATTTAAMVTVIAIVTTVLEGEIGDRKASEGRAEVVVGREGEGREDCHESVQVSSRTFFRYSQHSSAARACVVGVGGWVVAVPRACVRACVHE